MSSVRILSHSDICRLYLAVAPATKLAFELLFLTGTSPEELESLCANDYECPHQELFVEGLGQSMNRFLFVSKRTARMLAHLSAAVPSRRFIDALAGRRMTAAELTAELVAGFARCEFDGVSIEDLRWTLGSWMIDAKGDLSWVAAYLGTDPRCLLRRLPKTVMPVPPLQTTGSTSVQPIRKRRLPEISMEEVVENVSTKFPKFSPPM